MEYLEVADAIDLPGLRLVLTAGVPGPWSEAAKAVFGVKKIPYTAVRQLGGLDNPTLLEWTGHDNAPIAVYADEKPRAAWQEILFLAERLAPEPRLIPLDAEERVRMFGLIREIAGEQGFLWSRRLGLIHGLIAPDVPDTARAIGENLGGKYGYDAQAAEAAPARVVQILELLSGQLAAQRERGSRYFIGDALSALDLYWATAAAMIEPLPEDLCPMPRGLRAGYELSDPKTRAAADASLLEHRDFIYREHIGLPLDF